MKKTDTSTKKKTRYLSMSFREFQILKDDASFEATLMYLILKKLSKFKTGVVPGLSNIKVTYQSLADDLSRPASQGKPAITISRQQARDIIIKLSLLGLVSNVNTANDGLTMLLPLSPIAYLDEEETEKYSAAIGAVATSSAKNEHDRTLNQVDLHSGFPDMDDTSSVLSPFSTISTKSYLNNDTGEGAPSPAVASNVHPHPILEEANPEKSQSQKLADSFEQLLKQADFELTSMRQSREAFQGWAAAGITIEQVTSAMKIVIAEWEQFPIGGPYPLDVSKVLRANAKRKSTGRGKVAL